jgi:hypothetical protein
MKKRITARMYKVTECQELHEFHELKINNSNILFLRSVLLSNNSFYEDENGNWLLKFFLGEQYEQVIFIDFSQKELSYKNLQVLSLSKLIIDDSAFDDLLAEEISLEIRKSKAIRKHHFIEYPSHYEHIDGRGMGFYSRIPDQEYNFSRRLILLALAYAYLGAIENISNRLSECICCQSDDIEKLRQLYIEATKFKAVFLFHQPVLMKNVSLIETWKYLDKVFDINSASDELLEQLSSVHYILNLDDDKKRKNIEDLKIKRQEKWNMLFTMLGIFIGLIELFK